VVVGAGAVVVVAMTVVLGAAVVAGGAAVVGGVVVAVDDVPCDDEHEPATIAKLANRITALWVGFRLIIQMSVPA